MPTTRRSSSGTRSSAAPSGKQATLSFHNRVTKATAAKSGKKDLVSTTPTKPSPLAQQVHVKEELDVEPDVKDVSVEDVKDEEAPVEAATAPERSAAELKAEQISQKQIDAYWRKLEKERIAKRVHQGDLTLAEKVLRYFDVSSQYGPCVGITRMKRWERADRLGLNPPVEVLAVLLKEEKKGSKGMERAHMDEILNSTAVGAV